MKETKMKVSVSISPEVVRTLDDYAMLLNVSRSRILDDILLQALPAMKPFIDAMVALKNGASEGQVMGQVMAKVDESVSEVEQLLLNLKNSG